MAYPVRPRLANDYFDSMECDELMSGRDTFGGLVRPTLVTPRVLSIALALALVWSAVSWLIAENLIAQRSSRLVKLERDAAWSAAAVLDANVGAALAKFGNIAKVVARQPEIEAILARQQPAVQQSIPAPQHLRQVLDRDAELNGLAKRLEALVVEVGVDQIWVMDAAGNCIASGGFAGTATATGGNYLDREYFSLARREGAGRQFAVGRTGNRPGIYHAAAVTSGQRFLGVVAVKIDVSRLSPLVSDANALITDENGVVILAGDHSFVMKSVPGAGVGQLSESERLSRYRRRLFEALTIEPVEREGLRLVRLEGHDAPMVDAFSYTQPDMLKVWVFRELSELPRIRREGRGAWLVLLLAGVLLMVGIVARARNLRGRRERQLELARVNAELVTLNDLLLRQARFDSMTGCSNRRYFLEELDLELRRSARFAFPCCLAVLDIDHFKEVNDQYGHAAGDVLLKHFTQTVGHCLRSSDLLGRLGGEEFALLMPQTKLDGAIELAERVRAAVESSCALAGPFKVCFTVSIGVEQWRGGEDSVESLVARADQAMYTAKHDGRNRVRAQSASYNLSLFGNA